MKQFRDNMKQNGNAISAIAVAITECFYQKVIFVYIHSSYRNTKTDRNRDRLSFLKHRFQS